MEPTTLLALGKAGADLAKGSSSKATMSNPYARSDGSYLEGYNTTGGEVNIYGKPKTDWGQVVTLSILGVVALIWISKKK